jgi:predicted NBD/HSP70 family sugar kinase
MNPPAPGSNLTAAAGSRNEQTRRHNLSTLLTLVHHRGATSRADLTRLTGLNRSTIGALAADLAASGLVFESAAMEAGTVGRPSPMINPNADVVALAVNPDVDAITVATVGLGGIVLDHRRRDTDGVPTPETAAGIVQELAADAMANLPDTANVVGVGVAVPGLVRAPQGIITRAPHLGWDNVAWGDTLAEHLNLPVFVGNDAAVAVIAEAVFGAGRGASNLMYLNGSASGIGGGVIAGGSLLVGADGYAGELGHTLVTSDGERCYCGRRGCLETEVNMGRLQRAATQSGLSIADLSQAGASATEQPFAGEVDREADVLAHGIANLISVFNPESVVLGGFLGDLYAAREDRILKGVAADAFAPLADRVRIEKAQLGDDLLMVGAAELAFAPLLHDPAGWFAGD